MKAEPSSAIEWPVAQFQGKTNGRPSGRRKYSGRTKRPLRKF
ncbi:MAG TPA: hypothetical protein PLK77_11270 [Pyrinomonadaceae bacterium]|nr:hypothetical protein [Pyrinomonadaceae bacterium]